MWLSLASFNETIGKSGRNVALVIIELEFQLFEQGSFCNEEAESAPMVTTAEVFDENGAEICTRSFLSSLSCYWAPRPFA